MTSEKMVEMMEFFEAYEMFKAMRQKTTVSSRTEAVISNVEQFYNNNNTVQNDNNVVNLGNIKNSNDVLTKFTVYDLELDGKKYYCIKSEICTRKKIIDKVTGQEKIKKFNISAKQLANNMIKSVDGIITLKVPFENKSGEWSAWGFKTRKKALEIAASLPKIVKGEDIDKANQEYFAKKGGR